ncbi:hypothetical protein GGR52DRAFT_589923 [Hypoxylon sp. FL1284]|nr:hypothetical protein GGR52DRAFT_589923 [Hypoxylon sp. FL1284]
MAQDIAARYRELYRAKFRDDVLAGNKQPFLIPLHFLGVYILPTLYLAIPHRNRPWLYRARWLVLAIVVFFNFHMIRDVSSHNFGTAYGVGLVAAWGIVWNFTLLVWTKPQWDAKRVERRRKKPNNAGSSQARKLNGSASVAALGNGHATKLHNDQQDSLTKCGSNSQQNGNSTKEKSGEGADFTRVSGIELDAHAANGVEANNDFRGRQKQNNAADVPVASPDAPTEPKEDSSSSLQQNGKHTPSAGVDLGELVADEEFEYCWQEYPENESFWVRLDWAFDIVSTFRMTGWNWAIPCLPPYEPPAKLGNRQLPLSAVGPQRTRQGYARQLTRSSLLARRLLLDVVPSYAVLDLCAVYMTADPYFVLGPEHLSSAGEPLPPHLSSLPPLVLYARRTALSFAAVVSALRLAFAAGALALAFLPPLPRLLGFRAHPWHLPSAVGDFAQVLDRGLAGFWGAWWHQTFRFGFEAPARWLEREGHVRPGSLAAHFAMAAAAFVQSGFLHASGSYSTVPGATRWWLPPAFFLLSGVGTVLQSSLARAPWLRDRVIARLPRTARRIGNLAFVLVWLSATSWLLVDDFGRCGLWLFEPVPFSFTRALGIGPTTDRRVWRLEPDVWPRWYWGRHWWNSGIGI